ncbi:MAG: hypothetical protein M3Q07_11620, partial [Pseudobdellovibrionaceae bacterium]|nr:hypothetical protein [Pseudobdellovibrionaceae bacterium]
MAETDEEKATREEAERKQKEDEDKKSNFKKVQEDREAQKARADAAEAKLREREEADKKAAEAKLTEEKKFEELATSSKAEAEAAKAEATAAKAEAETANAKLKKIEDQQEAELTKILETIPEDKRPPLDETDSVDKRLAQVRYAQSLLDLGPKPAAGAGVRKGETTDKGRYQELKDAEKTRQLTEDEAFE